MAAADNNVRPWRQAPAATARRARSSSLARLLLHLLELLQLDRKLLLLLAASFMPACIIPIGPDWQDPPGEENVAPQVRDATPFFGTELIVSGTEAKFSIDVTDANGDGIFLRWFAGQADQPFVRRLTPDSPPLPKTVNKNEVRPIQESFDCLDFMYLPARLNILAVVADRDFVASPITVEEGGKVTFASWTMNFPCPTSSPQ
jgi:hypothetical protein